MSGYPPEPWTLAGDGQVTAWRVGRDRLPPLPAGTAPLALGGTALAVTAFVDYAPSGLLSYRELLAAVLVRHGRGPALTITDIWVDSEPSREGGRALWGIPKELAAFPAGAVAGGPVSATVDGRPVAEATYTARRAPAVPLPLPLVGRVVQTLAGETVATRVRASGRVRPATATWTLPGDGPLGWLAGARPVAHVLAEGFSLTFGPRLRP